MRGVVIALEGLDGSGKTTVAERLASAIRELGREVVLIREPGGTSLGEHIRILLLGAESDDVVPEAEALLFAASRAQLVGEVIRPAIARGAVVITDRFTDSSLAYQWGGRGLPLESVQAVQRLATSGLEPDLKFFLDLPIEEAMSRGMARQGQLNRLDRETGEFHARVREAYQNLVAADRQRWRVIDAARSPETVWRDVWNAVSASRMLESSRDDKMENIDAQEAG